MLPSRPWPLWLLTCALLIGFPFQTLVHWLGAMDAGILHPQGDSPGPVLLGTVLFSAIVAPVVLGVGWLCLRHYRPGITLLVWRGERPARSALATAASIVAMAFLLGEIVEGIQGRSHWFEYLWPAYLCLWFAWLAAMRAAAVGRSA